MGKKKIKIKNFAILSFAIISFITTASGIYSSFLPDSFILALLLSLGIQSMLLILNLQEFKFVWLLILIPLLMISSGLSYAYYCENFFEPDFYKQAQKILLEKEESVLALIDLSVSEEKDLITEEFYNAVNDLELEVKDSNNINKDFQALQQNDDIQLNEIYSKLKDLSQDKNIDIKETEKLIKQTQKSIEDGLSQNNETIYLIEIDYANGDINDLRKENQILAKQQKVLQGYIKFFNVYKGSNLLNVKAKSNAIVQKMNDTKNKDIQKDIDKILEEIRIILIDDEIATNQNDYSRLMEKYSELKSAVDKMYKIYDLLKYSENKHKDHENLTIVNYDNPKELYSWKSNWTASLQQDKNSLRKVEQLSKTYKNEAIDMIDDINTGERFYIYDINYIEKSFYYLTYHKYKVPSVIAIAIAIFFDTAGILFRIIADFLKKKKIKET